MAEFNDFELHSTESIFQEGMDLLESDHFEEALKAFDFVVRQQPYNVDALFHRGLTLINLNRHDEAVTTLRAAITLAPTEAMFHSHCGYALMMGGDSEGALLHFDTALDLQPDSYQNKVYKACVMAERRKLGEAKALLEEVINDHPEDLEVVRHYANVLMALGEDDEAMAQFGRLLAENPNHLEAISRRGAIFLRQGKRAEAIRCLREYVALAPEDVRAWITLLEALSEEGQRAAVLAASLEALEAGHEHSEIYVIRARLLLDERQYDAAVTDLRRAKALDERNSDAHFLLARAYAERGRLRHAMVNVNRALQVAPREKRSLVLKATLHHQLGEYEQELMYLNALLVDDPTDYRLVKMKVDSLSARNLFADASACLNRFLIHSPGHRRALLLSAKLHEQLGDAGAAHRSFRAALAQEPVAAKTFLAYASFLVRQGDTASAADLLEKAVVLNPDDASVQTLRAVTLQALGRNAESIAGLEAFVRSGHATPEIHWLLGKARYALQNYAEALTHFQNARQVGTRAGHAAPDGTPTFRCLIAEAYTLHHLHRTPEAIRLLERHSGQFQQFDQEYHETLGELYEHIRAHSKAQALYAEGLRRYPQSATLHYRFARACAAQGKKAPALRHLAAAVALESPLTEMAANEPAFQRYALSPSMNRLVKWRFLKPRLKAAALIALWFSLVVAISYVARQH